MGAGRKGKSFRLKQRLSLSHHVGPQGGRRSRSLAWPRLTSDLGLPRWLSRQRICLQCLAIWFLFAEPPRPFHSPLHMCEGCSFPPLPFFQQLDWHTIALCWQHTLNLVCSIQLFPSRKHILESDLFAVKSLQSEEQHAHLGSQAAKWSWKEKPSLVFGIFLRREVSFRTESLGWDPSHGADWEILVWGKSGLLESFHTWPWQLGSYLWQGDRLTSCHMFGHSSFYCPSQTYLFFCLAGLWQSCTVRW